MSDYKESFETVFPEKKSTRVYIMNEGGGEWNFDRSVCEFVGCFTLAPQMVTKY